MERLDLTNKLLKLVDLKTKSKAPVKIYFMSQVFQEHNQYYDRRGK